MVLTVTRADEGSEPVPIIDQPVRNAAAAGSFGTTRRGSGSELVARRVKRQGLACGARSFSTVTLTALGRSVGMPRVTILERGPMLH